MVKRLNKTHRDMLRSLAVTKINDRITNEKLDQLLSEVQNEVSKEQREQFPEKDMLILEKYGVAKVTDEIPLIFYDSSGEYMSDCIIVDEDIIHPHIHSRINRNKRKVKSLYDGQLHKAYKIYHKARREHEQKIKQKHRLRRYCFGGSATASSAFKVSAKNGLFLEQMARMTFEWSLKGHIRNDPRISHFLRLKTLLVGGIATK